MSINKKRAKDIAYEYIRDRIISGEYLPNEKIDDVKIANELNMSKTPIREAIQVLVSQNFLTSTPKLGTNVTSIKIKDISLIYEPLANIQALAARIACSRINKEDIKQLRDMNKEIADAIKNDNFLLAMKLDKNFHNYILDIADNPYLKNFSDELIMQIQRLEYLLLTTFTSFEKTVNEHELLIDALEEKNEKQAIICMENNWLTTIPNINIRALSKLINSLK